jgi:chromosome partitioning protein
VEKAGYTVLPGSLLERAGYREAHNRGLSIAEVGDLDRRSQDLLHGLLALIVERLKARMTATRLGSKRTGRKA